MDVTSYMLGKKNGGVTPTGEVDINSNGVHNVSGYATANVSVPSNVQTKTASITTNGTTTITPDTGYDGISSLEVTTNVAPDLTEYFITQLPNGDGYSPAIAKALKKLPPGFTLPTNMANAFQYCTNLTEIPLLDTSSSTTFQSTFKNCTSLTTIPLLNTSNVTNFNTCFNYCINLLSIPQLNTSSCNNFGECFKDCQHLQTIPVLDFSSLTNGSVWNMFKNCYALTDDSLNNIMASFLTATNYTGTKTLYNLGLTGNQIAKCQTLSNWTALSNAGWTAQ